MIDPFDHTTPWQLCHDRLAAIETSNPSHHGNCLLVNEEGIGTYLLFSNTPDYAWFHSLRRAGDIYRLRYVDMVECLQ